MRVPSFFVTAGAVVGSTIILSACGGSDSTSGSTAAASPAPAPSSTGTMNQSNSKQLAALALKASGGLSEKASSGSQAANVGPGVAVAAVDQIFTAQTAQAVVQFPTVTLNCDGGGTATIQLTTATKRRLSPGDLISLTGNGCVQGDNQVDGQVQIKINGLTGSPSSNLPWSAALGVTFTSFQFVSSGDLDGLNGDLALTYNQSGPGTATFDVSGDSLTISDTKGGVNVDRTVTAFRTDGSVKLGTYTYRANFTITGDGFPQIGDGTFVVTTVNDLVQRRGEAPSQGELKVTASDNSSVTLTAQPDKTTVNVGIDSNGDGTIDNTTSTTWDELRTLL